METLEDRLREWDSDFCRLYRMTKQSPRELALVHLQDMLPEAAVSIFDLLKHDILTVQQMREFYKNMIAEEQINKRKKAKEGVRLHELAERL